MFSQEDELRDATFMILANTQDLASAMTAEEVSNAFVSSDVAQNISEYHSSAFAHSELVSCHISMSSQVFL